MIMSKHELKVTYQILLTSCCLLLCVAGAYVNLRLKWQFEACCTPGNLQDGYKGTMFFH